MSNLAGSLVIPKDSSTLTYLMIGIPALMVSLAPLYGAVRVWRHDWR